MDSDITTKLIVQVIFQEAQALDITGPVEVFAQANKFLLRHGKIAFPAYDLLLIAPSEEPVVMSSGIRLLADETFATFNDSRRRIDTLVISGGNGVENIKLDCNFINFVKKHAEESKRIASICTGTFALAQTGLLKNRKATTHWASCQKLADDHPDISVERDMIYVRDHNIYTSAGITAGIDLALAMVEEDFGRELALEVAKQLVVFMKRQGGQSQFSTALARQHVMDSVIKDTLNWVHHNPEKDLSMETLASQSAMSERNFNRVFKKEVGMTPGKYVEKMRVELATNLIETSDNNLQQIAARSGFISEEKMRRVFKKQLGVLPHVYRKRFGK